MKRRPIPLYHWSPVERRKSILRLGLVPGKKPTQHTQRFPVICWSDSPSFAWALSAEMADEAGDWDLWMTWSNEIGRVIRLSRNQSRVYPNPAEWRSLARVPKSRLWHVGTRRRRPRT